MKNTCGLKRLVLAVAALCVLAAGCSTVHFYTSSPEELAQDLMGPPGKLKKQVVVARFYNPSGAQDLDLEQWVQTPLKVRLAEKCKRVFLQDSPRLDYLAEEHFGPLTGVARNLELMAETRAGGAGAIVTGSLWKVAKVREKRGIYPFRNEVDLIDVSLDLWVYDSLTGAKVADARISSEKVFDKGEDPASTKWRTEVFTDIVEQMEDVICDALKETPWIGFVKEIDGGVLTIASGSEVGLEAGDLLWVCADGEVMDGVPGEQFVVPGRRLARAKVTHVDAVQSTVELVEEADVSEASWVSLRKKNDRINPF